MKVQKDTFFIRVQSDRVNDIGITGVNGREIKVDTDYNKYKHTTQIGVIEACPVKITGNYKYELPLFEGDEVAFHHFVCQPDHMIDEGLYRAEYFHLYALLRNGNIHPLEDTIFVSPILEPESNLYAGNIRIKMLRENIEQQGIVFAASVRAKAAGLQDGDRVFYTKDADYKMRIHDQGLLRMRLRNIVAIERDGELTCLHDKILVKEVGPKNKSGSFINARVSNQMEGVIEQIGKNVEGVEVGDKISYSHGALGILEHDSQVWASIELRNINYIMQ